MRRSRAVSAPQPPAYAARDAETWSAVRRLYESTGYEPVWLEDGRGRKEIAVLREQVQRASEDGLNPADYDLGSAETLQAAKGRGLFKKGGDPEPLMDADIRLSHAFLKFAAHLMRGRVRPGQVDKHWFGSQRDEDLVSRAQGRGRFGEDRGEPGAAAVPAPAVRRAQEDAGALSPGRGQRRLEPVARGNAA